MNLRDKVAVVTGAGSGIGAATAKALADEGAKVVVNYRRNKERAQKVKDAVEEAGVECLLVQADVSVEEQVKRMIREVMDHFGRIDILVNNAGITQLGSGIENLSTEDWDYVMDVNLKSAFLTSREVVPIMKKANYGRIINLTSMAAKVGGINASCAYSVSKAGLACFTINLAKELLGYNINVNAVSPGVIDTPMLDCYGPEKKTAAMGSSPRKVGRPEDVADAIVFLASSRADYITGEIIDVNGGLVMD